jgi:hypothetical protein
MAYKISYIVIDTYDNPEVDRILILSHVPKYILGGSARLVSGFGPRLFQ